MKYLVLLITLISSCTAFGQENEAIYLNLNDKENWKITENNYENNKHIILLVNNKASEHLNLISHLKRKNSDLVKAMNNFYNIEKGKSEDVKLTLIAKDLEAKEPWIMYSIQNVTNKECNCKEAQVWLLIQGGNSLHSCVMSVKNDLFTDDRKEEIIKVFKTAKVVYQ